MAVNHFGDFETGPQRFLHLGVVRTIEADPIQDALIVQAVQSAEEDDERHRLLDQWD